MKKLLIFILTILAICIFYPSHERPNKKKVANNELPNSMNERKKASLSVYLKDSIDTVYIKGAIADTTIINHVDSFVRAAIQLIDDDRLKEVWEKLDDEELMHFFLHPMNTVDNELELHLAIMSMNDLFLDKQTALRKNIKLWDFSEMHCSILEEMNKDAYSKSIHLFVLENLTKAYVSLGDTILAIEAAGRFKSIYDELYPNDSDYAIQLANLVRKR